MLARKTALFLCVLACLPMVFVGASGCAARPSSTTSLYAGNTMYRSAQYDKAVVEYSKAIREAAGRGRFGRDQLAQAYLNRGTAFEQMGMTKRAVADYDKAISLAFWNPAPYLRRAAAHRKLQQYDKAVADYTEAIRLRPDNGRAYGQRASAYHKLGKTGPAAQDVQMAACLLSDSDAPRRIQAALRAETAPPAQAPETSRHYSAGAPAVPGAAGEWKVSVMPYVWVPDVEGNATVQGVKTPANWSSRETLQKLDFTTAGRIEAWKNGWGLIFDGLYVKTGGSNNHPAGAITSVDINAELLMLDVAGSYRLVDAFIGTGADDEQGTRYPRFVFEPIAGLRFVYLKQKVVANGPGIVVQDSTTYVEPFVGGRVALDVTEHVAVQVRGDIGGFGIGEASDKTWNIIPGVVWRISDRISFTAAYRITALDFSKDSGTDTFEHDTTLKGPLVGLGIHF